MADDGAFVVVFTSRAAEGGSVMHARRYAADGSPLGEVIEVGKGAFGRVEVDKDGDFAVAFNRREDASYFVYARAYTAEGAPRRDPALVDREPGVVPDVDASRNGQFAVSWTSIDEERAAIFARRFTPWGYPNGRRLEVSAGSRDAVREAVQPGPAAPWRGVAIGSIAAGGVAGSSITALRDGRFHVVWNALASPNQVQIRARSYDVWANSNVRLDLPSGIQVYPPSVVKASILGSAWFDVTLVDTQTLGLGPNRNPPKPGNAPVGRRQRRRPDRPDLPREHRGHRVR